MKKEYKRPVAESVQLETAPVMNTTSTEKGEANVGNEPVVGPNLSGERRGEWGNLW